MFRKFFPLFALIIFTLLVAAPARAQSSNYKYFSLASDNATLASKNPSAQIQSIHSIFAVNTTATVYYVKFYDKATAPVCGTDTPIATYPIPASTSGGGFTLPMGDGMIFGKGIGFCIVALQADSDDTSAATGLTINFTYNTH